MENETESYKQRPRFKPTIATVSQVEQMADGIMLLLDNLTNRVVIIEAALSSVIEFLSDEESEEPEQLAESVPEEPEYDGTDDNISDEDWARIEAFRMREERAQADRDQAAALQAQVEADWEGEGGA